MLLYFIMSTFSRAGSEVIWLRKSGFPLVIKFFFKALTNIHAFTGLPIGHM